MAVGSGTTIVYTRDGGLTWKKGSVSGVIGVPPLASVSFQMNFMGGQLAETGREYLLLHLHPLTSYFLPMMAAKLGAICVSDRS
jgi:hypothetical protein